MAEPVCLILDHIDIFEYLNSFITSLMLGEAWPILLMSTIYLIISGARISLTPKPQSIMKGNQGMVVAAYNFMIMP